MPARKLTELLGELRNVVASTAERQACYAAGHAMSSRIAAALPLVRRLKARGVTSPWQASVQSRALEPKSPCTTLEERAGIDASVYFFLGCAAYPKGDVAIVLHSRTAQSVASSFWPFDTGSLGSHLQSTDGSVLDSDAQGEAFRKYWGSGADVSQFTEVYLAAHFAVPIQYVRCGQTGSPDFPAYHGLTSRDNDRRAWTLEVQAHGVVSLAKESGNLKTIIVQRHQLLDELPDDLSEFGKVANDVSAGVREEIEQLCI